MATNVHREVDNKIEAFRVCRRREDSLVSPLKNTVRFVHQGGPKRIPLP